MNNKKINILVTGCAGFIGFHLSKELLKNKLFNVSGIDNMNSYYDIKLKKDRLSLLKKFNKFIFFKVDIENQNKLKKIFNMGNFDYVIHLAAQAGVRHSITEPRPYLNSNILGFFNIIDLSRQFKIKHFLYASTSSVYGDSNKFPLNENLDTSSPNSFYAATKKANEVIAYSYSHIHKLKTTGLRFFTVYGPFGRPDMALYKFTESIIYKKKLDLFNRGKHIRDFTYIDDVIMAVIKLIKKPAKDKTNYQVINIGSGNPKKLSYFLEEIEKSVGSKSRKNLKSFQMGDVYKTHADISKLIKKVSFKPKFEVSQGIRNFVIWYKEYFNINK